jgi:hypothetical protein
VSVVVVVTLVATLLGIGRSGRLGGRSRCCRSGSRRRGVSGQGEHGGSGQGSHGSCDYGDLGFHCIAPELIEPLRAAQSITRQEQSVRDMRLIMTAW